MSAPISDEVIAHICEEVACGRSIAEICRSDPGMPHNQSIVRRRREDERVHKALLNAFQQRVQMEVETILDLSDDSRNDWMERNDPKNPGWLANHDHISRSRLRIESRRWLASKLLPHLYGDKLEVTQKTDYESMGREQIMERIEQIAARLGYKLVRIEADA